MSFLPVPENLLHVEARWAAKLYTAGVRNKI